MMRFPRLLVLAVVAAGLAAVAPDTVLATGPVGVSCQPSAAVKVAGKPLDLTGVWKTNQGTYYLRQIGTCVWWYGQSSSSGTWAHVFFGRIAGPAVRGLWSDVPAAAIRQSGTLALKIDVSGAAPTLVRTAQTGNFGDSSWTKAG